MNQQQIFIIIKHTSMKQPKATVYTIQQYMLAAGMAFAFLQFGILIFVGSSLLPLLGPPDTPAAQRFIAFATYADRFKLGNYLMTLPVPFFLLFLGGLLFRFRNIDPSYKSILATTVFSGVAFIMIWPMGAIVSSIGLDIAVAGGDKVTAGVFDSIAPYSLGLSSVPKSVFLFTLCMLITEYKWLSRTGFLLALLSFAGSLVIANGNFFIPCMLGNLLSLIWIFCFSLKMYRIEKTMLVHSIIHNRHSEKLQ